MRDESTPSPKPTNILLTFLKGTAMGAADVVPGVSGGTIAFISGIYERLLFAIKSITPYALQLLFKQGFGAAWRHIDGTFLLTLFSGILISVMTLAKALEWCMHHYPQLLWAFFFGLIIASSIYIMRQVERWNVGALIGLGAGIAIAYGITILSPSEAPNTYPMFFGAGALAICAMILPGISGSFILLLMGMYAHVLGAATSFDVVSLGIFAVGGLSGLLLFSHLLSWTFKNYKNTTLAVLAGFMIGSLKKVWPWQNVVQTRVNSKGETVPFILDNVLPANYDGEAMLLYCILLFIMGFIAVFLLERLGDQPEDGVAEVLDEA